MLLHAGQSQGESMTPDAIQKAKRIIQDHEGFRDRMYLDTTAHYTIGYGHNLNFMPISTEAADTILQDDLSWFIDNLPKHIPWFNDLDEPRQIVLLDMAYNLGIVGLMRFKNMLSCIVAKDWEGAASEMASSRWAVQVGQRAITNARIMRTGSL